MLSIVYQCIPTVMLIVIVIWAGITCLALQKNDQHVFSILYWLLNTFYCICANGTNLPQTINQLAPGTGQVG